MPERRGIEPGYEQKAFPEAEKRGRLRLLVSPNGAEGSLRMHQDACLYAGLFDGNERASLTLSPERLGYVHMAQGRARVNGHELQAGDALKLIDEPLVQIEHGSDAEVLVFDLPR